MPINLRDYDKFDLVLNDLTMRQDSGTIDQAITTLEKVFAQNKTSYLKFSSSSILDKKKYKNISITLKQISAEKLVAMLNPDIEVLEAPKEIAIT